MSKKKKILDFPVLGRDIGTGTGWDVLEFSQIVIYDFEPKEGVNIPYGDLTVEYDTGLFVIYNDAGEVTWQADMVATLKDVSLDLSLAVFRGNTNEDR